MGTKLRLILINICVFKLHSTKSVTVQQLMFDKILSCVGFPDYSLQNTELLLNKFLTHEKIKIVGIDRRPNRGNNCATAGVLINLQMQ
jgi:hypothetical protein